MIELVVRLVILFGVVFGAAYGVSHAIKGAKERKKLVVRDEATERIRALQAAYDAGELSEPEYDELTMRIYVACREKGIELADGIDPPRLKGRN